MGRKLTFQGNLNYESVSPALDERTPASSTLEELGLPQSAELPTQIKDTCK